MRRCLYKKQRDSLARPQAARANKPHFFADKHKKYEERQCNTQDRVLAFTMNTNMRLGAQSLLMASIFEDVPLTESTLQMGNLYKIVQKIGQHLLADVQLAPATTTLKTPQWKKHRRIQHIFECDETTIFAL